MASCVLLERLPGDRAAFLSPLLIYISPPNSLAQQTRHRLNPLLVSSLTELSLQSQIQIIFSGIYVYSMFLLGLYPILCVCVCVLFDHGKKHPASSSLDPSSNKPLSPSISIGVLSNAMYKLIKVGVLVSFPVAMIKYSYKSHLRDKRLVLPHSSRSQSIGVRKWRQQVLEAVGHTTLAIRKQATMDAR